MNARAAIAMAPTLTMANPTDQPCELSKSAVKVMIWLSVKRDFFSGNSSVKITREFHFWPHLLFRGDYLPETDPVSDVESGSTHETGEIAG